MSSTWPPGSQKLLDAIKERVNYAKWHNRNRLGAEIFIKNFLISGGELPGWTVQRFQPVRHPDWPAATRVLWRPSDHSPRGAALSANLPTRVTAGSGSLLHLDLFECSSRSLAHDFLVQLLGEFELPGLALQEASPTGDVHFSHPAIQVALFARGNLVLLLSNAELSTVSIAELATSIDQSLIRRPDPATLMSTARTRQRAASRIILGARVPLPLPAGVAGARAFPARAAAAAEAGATAPGPMLKIFAPAGELLEEEGQLVYHATAPGAKEVTLFALYSGGAAMSADWRFSVK